MAETKTEWYFIVNPRAGSGKTMYQWVPAEERLNKLGIPFITAYTDHKRHATALAYDAASEGYRRIVAVGGDGSVHEVFNGIMKWCDENGTDPMEFSLGVAPIGSGNDWIKSLGVPHDMDEVISLIARGKTAPIDVVCVRNNGGRRCYMANIGGAGFDSHVCKRVNLQKESGARGKKIYLKALWTTMFSLKSINIKVVADGNAIFEGAAYSFALGNGPYSGSGMRQVPLAVMDDGILDVMIVPRLPLSTLIKQIPRLFNGKLNESPDVVMAKCRSLEIIPLDQDSADIFELDGEIEGHLPISIDMDGRQINAIKG